MIGRTWPVVSPTQRDELAQRVDLRAAQRRSAGRSSRRSSSACAKQRATSPTWTGWNFASGAASTTTGIQPQQLREQAEERIAAAEDDARAEDRPVEAGRLDERLRLALASAGSGSAPAGSAPSALMCTSRAHAGARGRRRRRLRASSTCARCERLAPRRSCRMPTRLTTASAPRDELARARADRADRPPRPHRRSAAGSGALPRSRRRVGDDDAMPRGGRDRATTCRPTKPVPPSTRTRMRHRPLSVRDGDAAAGSAAPAAFARSTMPSRAVSGTRTAGRARACRTWRWRAPSSRSRASR